MLGHRGEEERLWREGFGGRGGLEREEGGEERLQGVLVFCFGIGKWREIWCWCSIMEHMHGYVGEVREKRRNLVTVGKEYDIFGRVTGEERDVVVFEERQAGSLVPNAWKAAVIRHAVGKDEAVRQRDGRVFRETMGKSFNGIPATGWHYFVGHCSSGWGCCLR